MSRIGKKIIKIPPDVNISIDNKKIEVSGPLGDLEHKLPDLIDVKIEGANLTVRKR